jgi:hypothetical protein
VSHRLTPVQLKILRGMSDASGITRIQTGHKNTTMVELSSGELVVRCQSLVPYFLKHHGYIERGAGIAAWVLTAKGQAAVDARAR